MKSFTGKHLARTGLTLQVPTVNDRIDDFEQLFSLYQQALDSDDSEITLNFSMCRFLRHSGVAFVGGLIRFLESKGRNVLIDWNSIDTPIYVNLKQNGFCNAFDLKIEGWIGNSIPYREDILQSSDDYVSYLVNSWLGRGWLDISERLKQEVVSRVAEIYENSCEHANSSAGIFTCGQRYPNLSELNLCIVDFGVGIPHRVKNHPERQEMSASEAIKWALERGNSTRDNCVSGGEGLDTLKRFVTENSGIMQIISHNGYVLLDKNAVLCNECSTHFRGTLVNIRLHCDESRYYRKPHRPDKKWFTE